jgi:thiamine biosynthesis lipoprotein
VRIRQWRAAGRLVHHLVDPRTGLPGGQGLQSVTVVNTDPAIAEVWSKALFLCGRATIEEYADRQHVAAMWVDDAGLVHMSSAMPAYVIWQAS